EDHREAEDVVGQDRGRDPAGRQIDPGHDQRRGGQQDPIHGTILATFGFTRPSRRASNPAVAVPWRRRRAPFRSSTPSGAAPSGENIQDEFSKWRNDPGCFLRSPSSRGPFYDDTDSGT